MTERKPSAEELANMLEGHVIYTGVQHAPMLKGSAHLLRSQAARIAELEAQVPTIKANALREAADRIERDHLTDELAHEGYDGDGMMPDDMTIPEWLRARADRIEKEGRGE